jgi:hypothetical protein
VIGSVRLIWSVGRGHGLSALTRYRHCRTDG